MVDAVEARIEEARCFFPRLLDRSPLEWVDDDEVGGGSFKPQQSSSEHEDPESKTSKSNSAAVVLGPGFGSSSTIRKESSCSLLLVPGFGLLAAVSAVDDAEESLEVPGTADIIAANRRYGGGGSRLRGWREAVPICLQRM